MRAVLAIELSAEPSWIAVRAGETTVERSFEGERGRALIHEVDRLLEDAGMERPDLAGILVGVGPGWYTGLRIACAAARTLGYALDVPVGGVSSFAAAALVAPADTEVHLVVDAYRNEVYHAAYRRERDRVVPLAEPGVYARADRAVPVPADAVLVGDPELVEVPVTALADQVQPRASALLELVTADPADWAQCEAVTAADPLYLRAAARRPSAAR